MAARLRPRDIKGSTNQIHELEALLNRELGANLNVNENHNLYSRNELMAYLNEHNFRQHEGTDVNRNTIEQFIDRILSERNTQELSSNINNDLKFLQPTKVMQQATHYDPIPERNGRQAYFPIMEDNNESEDDYLQRHTAQPPINIQQLQPEQWRGRRRISNKTKQGMKELQSSIR